MSASAEGRRGLARSPVLGWMKKWQRLLLHSPSQPRMPLLSLFWGNKELCTERCGERRAPTGCRKSSAAGMRVAAGDRRGHAAGNIHMSPLETSTCHPGGTGARASASTSPLAPHHRLRAGGQRGARAEMGERKGLVRAAQRRAPETADFPSLPQHCHLASLFQLLPSAGGGIIVSGGAKMLAS